MIEFRQLRHKAKLLIVSLINFVLGKLWGRKNKSFVPKTLLILRLDEIGDYVLFRNFLKEIRESERFKDYKITLCGNAAWKDLAEAFDKESVDEFIWISKSVKRGIEFELRLVGLAYKLRKKRFEVLINPVHSRTIWMDNLSRFTGAQWKIASLGDVLNMKEEVKKVTDKFYDELIPVPPDTEFEFFRNKEFTENLLKQAVLLKKPHITIPNSHGKSFRLVVFPGANGSWKTWPLRNYIEICRRLLQDFPKLQIVIAGSSREKGAAHELEISISSSNVLNLAGQASLLEIVKLMQTSVLTVSNESSPVHIAASIRAPVVCISHGKFFGRFDPYPSNIAECITYVYPERISRGYDGEDLIKSISVDKVYRIVKEKIEKAVENISSEAISSKNFIM